jgi:hypothetical protein
LVLPRLQENPTSGCRPWSAREEGRCPHRAGRSFCLLILRSLAQVAGRDGISARRQNRRSLDAVALQRLLDEARRALFRHEDFQEMARTCASLARHGQGLRYRHERRDEQPQSGNALHVVQQLLPHARCDVQ